MIVRRTLLLIFLIKILCIVNSVGFAQTREEIVGKWKGFIGADGWELKINVEFYLDENGSLKGDIDVPAQDFENVPLEKIVIKKDRISFIPVDPMVPGNPSFEGAIRKDKKSMSGIFYQGGAECAFTLKKITNKTQNHNTITQNKGEHFDNFNTNIGKKRI